MVGVVVRSWYVDWSWIEVVVVVRSWRLPTSFNPVVAVVIVVGVVCIFPAWRKVEVVVRSWHVGWSWELRRVEILLALVGKRRGCWLVVVVIFGFSG